MAFFNLNTYDISCSSHEVRVPDHSIAKLMYYVNCMCTLIELDASDLNRLRNYKNYDDLNEFEIRLLYATCASLDPDDFTGKIIFEDQDGDMCGTSLNRMYDLGEVQRSLVVSRSVVLSGQTRRVKKVMFYKPKWLSTYYTQPMAELAVLFLHEHQQQAVRERQEQTVRERQQQAVRERQEQTVRERQQQVVRERQEQAVRDLLNTCNIS